MPSGEKNGVRAYTFTYGSHWRYHRLVLPVLHMAVWVSEGRSQQDVRGFYRTCCVIGGKVGMPAKIRLVGFFLSHFDNDMYFV